ARSEVPADLEAIFRRMLAKKPIDRFASMAEVAQALESLPLSPAPQAKQTFASETPQPAALGMTIDAPAGHFDTAAAEATNPTVDLAPAAAAPSNRTALLVEPSRSQAVIIRNYLQGLGFTDISTLPSGQKALEHACSSPPTVVLSALHLHDMNGVELARRMRS